MAKTVAPYVSAVSFSPCISDFLSIRAAGERARPRSWSSVGGREHFAVCIYHPEIRLTPFSPACKLTRFLEAS
jgi:hypothetical protein